MISLYLQESQLNLPFAYRNRKHIFLTLENGLRCFLINDPSTDLVTGAILTNSGNFNDPPEVSGIAHLAEHIMMRGPRKNHNNIDHLIASSGGSYNAYTSTEKTCFYFEISTYAKNTINRDQFVLDSFLPAFSSRLAKPHISDKVIKLEITAVDDEHNTNESNKDKIYLHALRLLANPFHPFSRFGSGNISTLTNVSLHKVKDMVSSHIMRSFRLKNMVLVLKGPQTLAHLRKLVIINFSDVVEDSPSLSPKSPPVFDFKEIPLFGKKNCIFIKKTQSKGMRMLISLKNIRHLPNYGPILRLMCNLIGDESNDTLCDSLKYKLQWVNQVYVFIQEICEGEDMLVVEIDPTLQGHKKLDLLRDSVFFYIENVIAQVPESQLIKLALDFEYIEKYNYLNQDSPLSAIDEICAYGERLITGNIPVNDLIKGFSNWHDINEAYNDIQIAIKLCFSRKNWKIIVFDDDFKSVARLGANITADRKDLTFDFQYMTLLIPFDQEACFDFKISKINLNLQELAPIKPCNNSGKLTKVRDLRFKDGEPRLLSFDHLSEVWFKKSSLQHSGNDYTGASIYIKFPHVPVNAKNMVILDLIAEIVGRELKPVLYHLELLGNDWGIYSNVNGCLSLVVNFSGIQTAIQKQVQEVFFQIRNVIRDGGSYDYQQIKGPRKILRERYNDYLGTSGMKRVFAASYMILEENLPTPQDRIEALEVIDSCEIEKVLCEIRATKCQTSTLVSGFMTEDECYRLSQCVKITESENKRYSVLQDSSSIILDNGTKIFRMTGLSISAVMYYLQIGERSLKYAFAKAKVFEYIMALTANDELRRKRGLAYGFLTGLRIFRRTFGLYIALPSGVHSCDHIILELEEYWGRIESMLDSMTEDEFQSRILAPFMESLANNDSDNKPASGLFSTLEPQNGSGRKPTSAGFKEHWCHLEQILNGTYNFKSRNCEEELSMTVLRSVRLKDMREFAKRKVSTESPERSALIICSDVTESESRRKIAAKVLAFQLRQQGCTISEEDISEILQECSDQETFSDMMKPLLKHLSRTKQSSSFLKFGLKYMVGSTIRKTKEGWGKSRNRRRVRWPTYKSFKEIQQQSSTAATVNFEMRRERLQKILVKQWDEE